MKNLNHNTSRISWLIGLMLLAAITRLISHPANFTAILAVALFGGAKFKNRALAIIIPLCVMVLTDITNATIQFGGENISMGFHSLMPLVYGCIAITALIGIYVGSKSNPYYVIGGSLISSVLFFLVTNTGVWFHNAEYPQNLQGLMLCYDVAIPFFRNQIFGDLFFNGVLFGSYALVSRKWKQEVSSVKI